MSLQFDPVWSLPLLLLSFAAVVLVIRLGYPNRILQVSPPRRRLLTLLRYAVVALLFLMALRPALLVRNEEPEQGIVYVLLDASRSMQTEDIAGESRRAALVRYLQRITPQLEELRERVEVRIRDFSDQLVSVETVTEGSDGVMTALGKVLELTAEEAGRDRVPAVLLFSDGRQAAAGEADSDPIAAARRLGRLQQPVYTVAYGSAQAGSVGVDLSLDDLDVSRDVFQGNSLPIRVRLKALGAAGKTASLRVLLEDRTGLRDGEKGSLKPAGNGNLTGAAAQIGLQENDQEMIVSLEIIPGQEGDLKLVVEADPLPGEARTTNNRVETMIRVRRGGIRVACFDVIRSEQKWLRRINDSTRIQLDFHAIRGGLFADRNEIPDRYFEPGAYDACIIGDVPATAFRPDQLQQLARVCSQGAGLMMIGGRRNFGEGGYGQSSLASLLPVELPSRNQHVDSALRMLPSRDGLSHYVMQIATGELNRERWESLPTLTGANILTPRRNSLAQILAVSDQGLPLLIGQNTGNNRVLAFAGDTTWQWAMQGFEEEHRRFWRQVILWLTRKETDNSQSVWIEAGPRDLSPGMVTELVFGARDADGQSLDGVEFDVEVTGPDGTVTSLNPVDNVLSSSAGFGETLLAGDYWARVQARRDGDVFGNIGVTRFHVLDRDPELDNPAADTSLLRELSFASGGDHLSEDELQERLQNWIDEGLPGLLLEREERVSLWDNWGTLLLLIGLISAEWAFRRRSGLA